MALPVVQTNHPLLRRTLSLLLRPATDPKQFRELVHELTWCLPMNLHDLPLDDYPIDTPMGATTGQRAAERGPRAHPESRTWHGGRLPEVLPPARFGTLGSIVTTRPWNRSPITTSCPARPSVQVCMILDPMLATEWLSRRSLRRAEGMERPQDQVRWPHCRARGGATARRCPPRRGHPCGRGR